MAVSVTGVTHVLLDEAHRRLSDCSSIDYSSDAEHTHTHTHILAGTSCSILYTNYVNSSTWESKVVIIVRRCGGKSTEVAYHFHIFMDYFLYAGARDMADDFPGILPCYA